MRQVGNLLGVIDRRQAPQESQASPSNADAFTSSMVNFADDAALDARLTAISAAVYSTANLLKMTRNDKIFAILKNDEAASQ